MGAGVAYPFFFGEVLTEHTDTSSRLFVRALPAPNFLLEHFKRRSGRLKQHLVFCVDRELVSHVRRW